MKNATRKIWRAVKGLEEADIDSTAMCYSIINIMIENGVATRKEFVEQIERSVVKVVSIHKQIAEAMRERYSENDDDSISNTLH